MDRTDNHQTATSTSFLSIRMLLAHNISVDNMATTIQKAVVPPMVKTCNCGGKATSSAYEGDLTDSNLTYSIPGKNTDTGTTEASQVHTVAIQDPTAEAEGTATDVMKAFQVTEAILGTTIAPNAHKHHLADAGALHPRTIPVTARTFKLDYDSVSLLNMLICLFLVFCMAHMQ